MRKNLCLQVVTDELRQAGVDYQVEHGGKHLRVSFVLNGRAMLCTVSVSTAYWDAHRNARAGIRRIPRQAAISEMST